MTRQRQNVRGLVGLRQDAAGRTVMSPDEMSLKLRQPLQCIAARSSQSRMIGGRGGDYPKKCEASGAFLCCGIVFEAKVPALLDTLRDLLDFHCWRFEVGWKQNCWSV